MRTAVAVLGMSVILAYAVFGTMLMSSWELSAASGLPLDETIAAMEAAGQLYSVVPGVIFAVFGGVLAIAWTVATLAPAFTLVSPLYALSGAAAITAVAALIVALLRARIRSSENVGKRAALTRRRPPRSQSSQGIRGGPDWR